MRMNKIMPFALSAMLVGGATVPAAVFAKEDVKTEVVNEDATFILVNGTIDGVEKGDDSTLYTIKGKEEAPVLSVTDETLIFDNMGKEVELEKGDKVSAYTNVNKPMILVFPPQYSPDVVIVEKDDAGTAAVGTFDDELTDMQLKLQLNVEDSTDISSASGDKVKADDLKGKDLVVFYTSSTKSIPAQATPEKVVVLDGEEVANAVDEDATVEQIIENDHYMVDDVKMVPLRVLAEKLGYVVDSTGVGATVYKGVSSYTITRDTKKYGYNKSLMEFEAAPELLEPKKTYVPVGLIEEMMK